MARTTKKTRNYIDKKELLNEITISKQKNELTPRAFELLHLLAKRVSLGLRYKRNEDREDCLQEAMHDIIKYWRNFDPNYKNANAFAYYTRLILSGLAKGFKKIYPDKDIMIVNFSEDIFDV